jgi:catechol 2,3-dioxygenase-like lactoylglutathione lyase family enzyme
MNAIQNSLSKSLSRRNVLKLLITSFFSPHLLAQGRASPIRIQKLHTFGLRVTDVARSVAFYQDLFGMPIVARQGDTVCLGIGAGPAFFSLTPVRAGEAPGVSHIGISATDFSVDGTTASLEAHGIMPAAPLQPGQSPLTVAMRSWRRERPEANAAELFFADAEGLVFQLCSPAHCGGTGALGEQCGAPERASAAGLMSLVDINHFTNYMTHSPRANQFYLDLFGLQYQSFQGPNSPTVGVGDGKQFLMYVGGAQEAAPTQPGRIDHVSLSVTDFEVDAILAKLTGYGLTARADASATPALSHWVSMRMPNRGGAEGGTPELYFSDPDGLHIQLQHVDYCGGGGYLGDQCA